MNDDTSMISFGGWDVESLRLSVFHPERTPSPGLWEQLMGIAPESSDTRAREGVVQEQGAVGSNALLLAVQRTRLDWNLLPGPSQGQQKSPPILVSAEQGISLLAQALDVSTNARGLVQRLALGVVLARQAHNLSDGFKWLSKYLPRLDLEDVGGTDFVYQINRRRRSPSTPHILINRLAKWQLEEVQGGTFTVSPSGPPNFAVSERVFVSKLTLDINTAPSNNAFSPSRIPSLFSDFVGFAGEIATKGDI